MTKWAAIAHDIEKVAERHFLSFTGFAMHGIVLNIRGCGTLSSMGFFHGLTNFKLLYHIKMKNI